MKFLFGIIVLVFAVYNAAYHLGHEMTTFWDSVAFFVVFGGTIAAALMTMPSVKIKFAALNILSSLYTPFGRRREEAIEIGLRTLNGNKPDLNYYRFDQRILYEGIDLLRLGFSKEKVQEILISRVEQFSLDSFKIANWLRNLAKYPPAFGLAGTVLGLVHLMRGISEGLGPQETGLRMAVALMATFYGIMIANGLVNPLGERIKENVSETITLCEIYISTVDLIANKNNLLVGQETLNSYVIGPEKVDFITGRLEAS